MGQLHFETHIDFAKLDRDITSLDRKLNDLVGDLGSAGRETASIFNNIGAGVATYFSAQALGGFTRELVNVRGEFQQLEVAFETMLGSKAKADALMSQVVTLAGTTPFSLTEVASGAKQLLAVQVPAEEVEDTLRRIGDVSAGLSVPISQLIKAYGDVKAKTKLTGEEMRQFMGAGIPMVAELAKHFNVAESEISEMVSAGKVGFADVQAVLKNLTDEGGMFADLMAKQSKTLTGLVSNLGDAWDRMLNDIGQQNEGPLADGIKTAISLVENYEKVVDILKIAIATYGTYKAAVIMNAVAMKGLTGAIKSATIAQQLFNLASKANPVGLMMAGLTTIVGALYTYTRYTREAATATEEINQSITAETSKLNYLFEAIKRTGEGTEERKKLMGEVNEKYGNYLDNLLTEKSTLEDIEKAQRSATRALMADIAVKESRRKIDEELSGYTETLQKKFSEFSSVISKLSPAVHAEFLQELNSAVEQQAETAGDELKRGMLEYSSIAREVYNKYISSISQQTGYTKYDFSSFQKAFLDVAQVWVEKNKVINELNGYVDAYQQIFDKINQPTPGSAPEGTDSLRKDVEFWENERKVAKEALDRLTREDADFKSNQAKYLAQIEQAENEINLIRGKTEKEKQLSLTDSIKEQIEAWERYYMYIEHGHQDLAQKQSEALKTTANTLRDYLLEVEGELVSKLSVLDPSSEAYRDAAEALGNVKAKRQEVEGGKSVVEQYRDSVAQQKAIFQEYEEWRSKFGEEKARERYEAELKGFDSYVDYLEAEMRKFEGRVDPISIAKLHFVAGEKTSTETDQRKRTQQALEEVLRETQTHKEKLAMLELEYQAKLRLIEGDGNAERREMLRESYEKRRQELEAAHVQELDSYQWVFDNLDRMNRQALISYIQRLKDELSQARYQSSEMLQVRLQLEEKLAQAQQELNDKLPESFSNVGSLLRDATSLAGELDENLAKAVNTGAELAEAAASIAMGLSPTGNPLQIVQGVIQATAALVKYFSKSESLREATQRVTESLSQMNEQLDRQARLLDGMVGANRLEAYMKMLSDLENQAEKTKTNLFELIQEMSKGGTTGKWWGDFAMWTKGELGKGKEQDAFKKALKDAKLDVGNAENWTNDDWIRLIGNASGETKKRLEALYDQWVELQDKQEEYYNQWAEYSTGISFDGFVDEFVEALKSGERSAADFADNIEDMLRNAIIQGFKTQVIMKRLEPLYDELAKMAEDGLTESEISMWMQWASSMFEGLGTEFEAWTKAMEENGLSMFTDSANSLSGAVKGVTEETASIVAGQLNAMRINQNEHLSVARNALIYQAQIATNTAELFAMRDLLNDIKRVLNNDPLRGKGL